MAKMVSITEFEEQIRMQEGVIININRNPLNKNYKLPEKVRCYSSAWPHRLGDDAYVRQLAHRINRLVPRVSFHIVRRDGVTLYNRHSRLVDFRITRPEEETVS